MLHIWSLSVRPHCTCDKSVFFFISGTPVSSTNKNYYNDIPEILLKVALPYMYDTILPHILENI